MQVHACPVYHHIQPAVNDKCPVFWIYQENREHKTQQSIDKVSKHNGCIVFLLALVLLTHT